jgi:hypothetical protein
VCLHAGRYPPPALDFDVECGPPRRYHRFPKVIASSFDDFDDVSAKRDERTREDDDDSDDDDTTVPI